MVDWANLKMRDYAVSLKFAKLLTYDGFARKLVQLYTVTGTAFFWFFGLVIAWFTAPSYRIQIYTIMFVTLVMLVPVFIIKHTVKRPRPEFKDTRFGAVAFDNWSFPSGHATRGTYIMIIMSTYFPEWSWAWIIWGFFILLSRLLLGVHYVTDIIAGFIFSSLSMLIMFLIGWLPEAPFYNNFV